MAISSLFTLPDDWIVLSCEQGDKAVVVSAQATASISSCPLCHHPSDRIHSHYLRTIADLPCIGQSLCLKVQVRRFRCLEPDCPRKIFTERIPSFVRPSARMTNRLQETVQSLGLATTGEEGSRLASVLHIQVSAPTMIRRIMNLVLPPPSSVTALGIDDFSFRRGQTFGTILVDLERHTILDILPERSVESAVHWMKNHPEIQFVSRDRGQEYTQAAMLGAPQAVAIADRFHLVKNLIEAVEPVVARCCQEIRTHQPLPSLDLSLPRVKEWRQERTTYWQERTAHTQENAFQKHQLAQELLVQGKQVKEIATLLHLSTKTVSRWLRTGKAPYSQERRRRQSVFDRYAPYVLRRWKEGCHHGVQLYQEIQQQGFHGSARTVHRFLKTLREQTDASLRSYVPHPSMQYTPRDVLWLLAHQEHRLTDQQRQQRDILRHEHTTLQALYELIQWFRRMIRQRCGEELDQWLQAVATSSIPELHRFAKGLTRDKAAVQAALTSSLSNGMVEGFVNKVKTLKRRMFGRASPNLLRQRLLYAPRGKLGDTSTDFAVPCRKSAQNKGIDRSGPVKTASETVHGIQPM